METIERFSSFSEILQKVEMPIGMLTASTDPALVEMVGHAGFDFVVFDNEHCPIGPELCVDMVRAAEAAGVLPLVRIVATDRVLISKFLDSGVRGIVVPHCESADQTRSAIRATQYKPHGTRGWCPSNHLAHYSIAYYARHSERLTDSLAVLPIIESPEGLDAVDEILAIPEIETVFFGPGDYSHHIGVAGRGFYADEIQDAARRILEAGRRAGKRISVFPYPDLTAESARRCADLGFHAMLFGVDLNLLSDAYAKLTTALGHKPRL